MPQKIDLALQPQWYDHDRMRSYVLVFFGLIASGKSTVAEVWAKKIGATYYNSDRERKSLAGILANAPQQESFNAGIYTPEFSRRTYDRLLDLAAKDLKAGKIVVLDGSYQSAAERARLKTALPGGTLKFILCSCSDKITRERLAIRAKDPEAVSDGRWEIFCQQKENFSLPDELSDKEFLELNTEAPVHDLLERLAATLGSTG